MKIKNIYIYLTIVFSLLSIPASYASAEKSGTSESATHGSHTQHPPHDHHHTDHIKKLDESMRRKREDEESH